MPPALTFLSSTFISTTIFLTAISASAPTNGWKWSQTLLSSHALSSSSKPQNKRIVAARRSDTPDGSRLTLTSDSPLDDYSSYVEGERFFVHLPEATFIGEQSELNGNGFAGLRIEQRNDDVVISFRLQQGATVNISRNFNRLEILFLTNEQANKTSSKTVAKVS
ncbi:MAG: hypothetical protein QOH63_1887 [Acidobacteriota bacterium]|jgi:hypothetical protein|nr:hypothetical protein [Acidobacteriota bacterium]